MNTNLIRSIMVLIGIFILYNDAVADECLLTTKQVNGNIIISAISKNETAAAIDETNDKNSHVVDKGEIVEMPDGQVIIFYKNKPSKWSYYPPQR